ncbi:MAG: hypothetical protein WKF97_26065 [Chitinophagaceae bacterium]
MVKFSFIVYLCLVAFGSLAQSNPPATEVQIKSALLAAPADKREGAAVYGFTASKTFTLLRKGTNEMICIGDDPGQPGFSVACYHRDLQPFMERGRELRKQGKSVQEIFNARESEVKAGKLLMPKQPTTLFAYSASKENYDSLSGEVKNGYLRYVVYIPYATSESTGLPLKQEGPAMPWIMHPGTHGAHIMINPPKN